MKNQILDELFSAIIGIVFIFICLTIGVNPLTTIGWVIIVLLSIAVVIHSSIFIANRFHYRDYKSFSEFLNTMFFASPIVIGYLLFKFYSGWIKRAKANAPTLGQAVHYLIKMRNLK